MPRPIYLDHNATTPLDPDVLRGMQPFLTTQFGNPSSVDTFYGHEASEAVEKARQQVAAALRARPQDIVFTGSCTEANNLAIQGVLLAQPDKSHMVTSQVEHPSVLETFRALERRGGRVTYLPVDSHALVDPDDVGRALTPSTALVSVMGANNEVGSLQPIREIGAVCRRAGVLFHTDMAQLSAHVDIDIQSDAVDLVSLSAHKAYGPKGVGALFIRPSRPRAKLAPFIYGGGQERGLRPGTLATAAIAGMGLALEIGRSRGAAELKTLRALRDKLLQLIREAVDGVLLNGHSERRLPNNVSLSIPGVEPHALMRLLRAEVCFSASSACTTSKVSTSHVLQAMFGDTWRARSAFRLAVGRFTSAEDVVDAAEHISNAAVRLLRSARSAGSTL